MAGKVANFSGVEEGGRDSSEYGGAGRGVHMVVGAECGRPVNEPISGKVRSVALHIGVESGGNCTARWIFIVAIGNSRPISTMEVRAVRGHLGKVWVSRAAK